MRPPERSHKDGESSDLEDASTFHSLLQSARNKTTSEPLPNVQVPGMAKRQQFNESLQKENVRRVQIDNDNKEKDQGLKERTLKLLFIFLGFETLAAFILAFLQGFRLGGFFLDAWTLRVLVGATLLQTVGMLTIAIRHLFPQKRK